jgi:alcohol dehydrogenase class IV
MSICSRIKAYKPLSQSKKPAFQESNMVTEIKTEFVFDLPTRIEFGNGRFSEVGKYAAQFGKHALLVSYKDHNLHDLVVKTGEILTSMGIQVTQFEEVVTNPTDQVMDQGAQLARQNGCDLVIGLGGGSAIDVAKVIAVTAVENISAWEIVEGKKLILSPLPMIAVPTTSGTGSEVTQYAVISNPTLKRKEGIGKKEFYPKVSILDPVLTYGMPPSITAATGLDALTHAIEGYTTRLTSPLTDALAEKSIQLVSSSLMTAFTHGEDLKARSDMLLGSMLAGIVITHTDTSLAHVIGEAVGANFGIHHGLSVALTLPAVMEFNLETNIDKFATIAKLLGANAQGISIQELAKLAPEAFRKIIRMLHVPEGLAAVGVTENGHLLELCTRPGWDASNLRHASKEDFVTLIQGSLSPDMSYWKYAG